MSYLNTDVPELKGYDSGTVLSNIALLEGRLESMMETSLSQLSELADAILQDASEDPDIVFSILLSLRGQAAEDGGHPLRSRHILEINVPPLMGMTRHLGLYQRLILYGMIIQKIPSLPPLVTKSPPELPPSAKGRIAYMPGTLADKAYILFAEHIPHCRAAGFHGFVDACEEVWGGLCEYCILPLESTVEGKLTGFSRLIVKYRLQIVAVCDIRDTAAGNENWMRFALLQSAGEDRENISTSLLFPHLSITYLELLHITAVPSYPEIIAAAEFCGLSLQRSDTLPPNEIFRLLSDDGWPASPIDTRSTPLIATVWHTKDADLNTFLCYLALEAAEDPILGLYPSLSN